MIELPRWAVPDSAEPALVDAGGVMRSPLNTAALRVDRPGSHYAVALTFPPFEPVRGRVMVSRLIRAQREGLRVEYPLPEPQPVLGLPVIDGAGAAGLALPLRGIQPGTPIREGWWLSIVQVGGQRFLHNVAAGVVVGADGRVVLTLSEMLRDVFVNGATVELARPMIEGLIDGDRRAWSLSVEQQIGLTVTIEEAA